MTKYPLLIIFAVVLGVAGCATLKDVYNTAKAHVKCSYDKDSKAVVCTGKYKA